MRCDLRPGSAEIIFRDNPYSGFGPVRTGRGWRVQVLGAPWLFRETEIRGDRSDRVSEVSTDNRASAALIDRLLRLGEPSRWGAHLDGNFLIAAHDPEGRRLWVITDLGNSYPLYRWGNASGLVLGTDLDGVARAGGCVDDVDDVSLTEYLLQQSISWPHTFYRPVKETPYACCLRIDYGRERVAVEEISYWRPSCAAGEVRDDLDGLAVRLRGALNTAFDRAVAGKKRIGLFLSGGSDSRILAEMCAARGLRATAITVTDADNREARIAREVAVRNGLDHRLWRRDLEYYPRLIDDFIRRDDPQKNFTWAMFLGFREEILAEDFDVILGGYMSDSLLKLHEADVRARHLFGRHLGVLEDFDTRPRELWRDGAAVRQQYAGFFRRDLLEAAAHRRAQLLAHWEDLRQDGSAWEWSYIWPFARNKMNSNLTTHINHYPAAEIFTCREVIEVARVAARKLKLNSRLFNAAFAPLIRNARHVPYPATMLPLFSPAWLNEAAITLRHLLPRRWMGETPGLRRDNPAATEGSTSDLAVIWRQSHILRERIQGYDPDLIETRLRTPGAGPLLEDPLDGLSRHGRNHLRFTLLHLAAWRRNALRAKGCEPEGDAAAVQAGIFS